MSVAPEAEMRAKIWGLDINCGNCKHFPEIVQNSWCRYQLSVPIMRYCDKYDPQQPTEQQSRCQEME